MNATHSKPTPATGALIGVLLTAPLIALFYLAAGVLGTPFVPFDLFDWLARVLPGGIITFGIDLIVSLIAALNLEDTSRTAKTAEHSMALLVLLVIGAAAGAALFARLRWREAKPDYRPGLILGAVIGAPAAILSGTLNQTASADPFLSPGWILLAFLAWGASYVWVYNALTPSPSPSGRGEEDTPTITNASVDTALQNADVSVEQLDRRGFLIRLGGATAAITVVGAVIGALTNRETLETESAIGARLWSADHPLPNTNAALQPVPGTRAEFTPVREHYRIDINSLPPVIREDSWALTIDGLVDQPLELTLQDIREKYEPLDQFITLSCISNSVGGDLIGTQRWTGVPLKGILNDAKPRENAVQLHITSADGFDEYLSRSLVDTDERIMLAYAWDGLPLPTAHGFPLRVFIPDRYGMKQPKWIVRIELNDTEDEGYWVRRGWDPLAQVQATSVVDTVFVDQDVVQVGGIAYAGKRGISRVEVKVDEGAWQEAQLRDPISDLTWVIWRTEWPFQAGDHTFFVRCVDGNGAKQIETARGSHPSGATGIDRKRATV